MIKLTLENNDARELIAKKLRALIPSPCTRILFINPQFISEEDFRVEKAINSDYWAYQPYGCGVLCRDLEMRGYATDILDLNFEMLYQSHKLGKDFRYSLWKDWLLAKLEEFKPDIVALSCMFTMSHNIIKNIAAFVKKHDPQLPVIGGGVHLSNAWRHVLKDCEDINFIGIYECDKSFPDLIDFINGRKTAESLAQIITLIDDRTVAIESRATPKPEEIDVAPLYHDLPVSKYSEVGRVGNYGFMCHGRKGAPILTNRGCRAHCSFCSVATFNGPGVRSRSIESILDEIKWLYENGIRHLSLLDDDPLNNKKRAVDLFKGISDLKLDITWDGTNGLIAAAINDELMQAMAESGCIGFNLGIETGSPEILRSVHKPGTVETFMRAKGMIDKYPHIFVMGFLIIGFPNETHKQLMQTAKLAHDLCLDWYPIQILNPLPSTEIYDQMVALGLIQDGLQTSEVAFVAGPHGRQYLNQQRQKLNAEEFFNLFKVCDPNNVPTQQELMDYWFLMDYKVNYEKILGISEPIKLRKLYLRMHDISERIAPHSAIAQLFQGVIERKLGNEREAKRRAIMAKRIVHGSGEKDDNGSAYWQKRFDALELHSLLGELIDLSEEQKSPAL